jgi:hypothetical protein
LAKNFCYFTGNRGGSLLWQEGDPRHIVFYP